MAAPPNTIMIIHLCVNCKDYQGFVDSYRGGEASKGQFRCTDPDCRCDKFYRHGFYNRYLLTVPDDLPDPGFDPALESLSRLFAGDFPTLSILRVKCSGCGATHAILPADAWPFHIVTLPLVLILLLNVFHNQPSTSTDKAVLPSKVPYISWQLLSHYVKAYLSCRQRMITALKRAGLFHHAQNPSDIQLLLTYLSCYLPPGSCSFFLDHIDTPPLVTRHSTCSYPLRFIPTGPA